MKKYKKKVNYGKIEKIFDSATNVIIGQFDNTQIDLWNNLKENCKFLIPKNTLCRSLLKQSVYSEKYPTLEIGLFEGPIFCLSSETEKDFCDSLMKIKKAKVPLYGGIFKGKFYNFAEINEIELLINEDQSMNRMFSCIVSSQQKLENLNPFSMFQQISHQLSLLEENKK